MPPSTSPTRRQIALALLFTVVCIALGIGAALLGGPAPTDTVTTTLGGPGHVAVALTPAARDVAHTQASQAASGDAQAAHADLKAEPAAAHAPAVLAHNAAAAPRGQPVSPAHVPAAATVGVAGCVSLPVRNYSSRAGSPTDLFVLHQTISPDDGKAGVLGNVSWFNSPAALASADWIVARTSGYCAQTVAPALKAWHVAGFNRVSLGVEVTETGHEGTYLTPGTGGWNRVIALMRWAHRVYHLPYQHGAVSGCSVVRIGYVEHRDLGACGGGHFDDAPYSIDPLIAAAAALDRVATLHAPATALERHLCATLQFHRRRAHELHRWDPPRLARATQIKNDLAARRVRCPSPYR